MNVLINSDEWLAPWSRESATNKVKQQVCISWNNARQYVRECRREFKKTGLITIDFKHVNYLLEKDLREFRDVTNQAYKIAFKDCKLSVLETLQQSNITDRQIVERYLNDTSRAFAKSIAPQLTNELNWILDVSQADWQQSFFIRNVVNNESLLNRCLTKKLDFWFVDTGYTNFLYEKQKVWHRLIKNHIHHGEITHEFPTDRLHHLSDFPRKWRKKGSKILVIESSPGHYKMHGTTLEQWRQNIIDTISQNTDREIEFRPKHANRKTRQSVYNLLKESKDYYCVISDSSAAAVEAIWTGIPAITLDRHITNSVSRNSLTQINDLYCGDLEQWFAMLSYSQYTFEELCNGTAVSIIKEHFDV